MEWVYCGIPVFKGDLNKLYCCEVAQSKLFRVFYTHMGIAVLVLCFRASIALYVTQLANFVQIFRRCQINAVLSSTYLVSP